MNTATAETIDVFVSDVSGQKEVRASQLPRDATIAEVVQELLAKMGLGRHDASGRALNYRARLDREARHLNGDERVGDALRPDDRLTLHPSADAGAAAAVRDEEHAAS
jgi:hypothetical protein